jgi:hypothetical protein
MQQFKIPVKIITFLILLIWVSPSVGAGNLLINNSKFTSVVVLDSFKIAFDFGAGDTCAQIEVWLDVDENEQLDAAADLMLFNSANEGEKFCDGNPQDLDGAKNGAYLIWVDEFFALAPAQFIFKVENQSGSDTAVLYQVQVQSPYAVQGAVLEPPKIENLIILASPENQSPRTAAHFMQFKQPGRTVQADDGKRNLEMMTRTDSTGAYVLFLPAPQPMNWNIRSYDEFGRLDRNWMAPAPVKKYVDGILQDVNFRYLKPEAWLSGKVTDEKMAPLRTPTGEILEVRIIAQGKNNPNTFETKTENGIFVLPVVAGNYEVWVGFEAPQYMYPNGNQNITVQTDDSLTAIDFMVYNANSKITGWVTENQNTPLTWVEIRGYNPQTGSARTFTNEQGFYSLLVSDKGANYQVELPVNYIPGHLMVEGGNIRQTAPGAQNVNFNLVPKENNGAPRLLKIQDIPHDQGLQVRVIWQASGFDFSGNNFESIQEYGVWRGVPQKQPDVVLAQLSKNENFKMVKNWDAMLADFSGAKPGSCYLLENDSLTLWDFITRVPAIQVPQYAVVAPTLGDSTAEGIYYSYFLISAHSQNSTRHFLSNIAHGYSVDNLRPPAPVVFATFSDNRVVLTWDPSPHPDVIQYNVYRGESHGFLPEENNRLGYTPENQFTDKQIEGERTYYYRIEAVDDATNHGISEEIVVQTTDVAQVAVSLPREFALLPNYPNPFNSMTEFQFALPRDEYIEIRIYNLIGAEIANLVQGTRKAGTHEIRWDGKNMHGQDVASGIYLYKMKTNLKIFTRKMLLLR